jgi:hypothetical protein
MRCGRQLLTTMMGREVSTELFSLRAPLPGSAVAPVVFGLVGLISLLVLIRPGCGLPS